MRTIWKYTIPPEFKGSFSIPDGYRILHLDKQDGQPCIWVEVDPSQPETSVEYMVYGTGWEIPDDWEYIGTWQQEFLVWHLFIRRY